MDKKGIGLWTRKESNYGQERNRTVEVLESKRSQLESRAPVAQTWRWCVGPMPEALDEAGEEWHCLGTSTDAPPTALPLWYASLYEAFGEIDGPVTVHRLYAGSRLVAVLPLVAQTGKCRVWRPYQERRYTPFWAFPLDEEVEGAAQEIRRHLLSSADVVDFKYMHAESGQVAHLIAGLGPSQVLVESNEEEADMYTPLDGPRDECLKHMASRLARQTRQHRRRLERQGNLVLSVLTEPDEIEANMTECLELERAGWKGRNGTAMLCLPKVERFYRTLARLAADLGLFAIYTLRLDGRLIACNLSLRTGTRIDALKIAYDEEMAQSAPGNVMNYTIHDRECEEGRFASFHWGNPTAYKLRWTDCSHRLVRVLLFSGSIKGRANFLAYTYGRPLRRRCRKMFARTAEQTSDEQHGESEAPEVIHV